MSVLEIDLPVQPTPAQPRPIRKTRHDGRTPRPRLKPAVSLPAPTIAKAGTATRARACGDAQVDGGRRSTSTRAPASVWRLTDRGIAVVLVLVAMVAAAALAVVVPTALRVTGENYQPSGTSQLARP